MKITVFHKPNAGEGDWPSSRVLAAVHRAGLKAQYHAVDGDTLDEHARNAESVVVVAGGDGTVERVACALHGREASLVILPTGGSNNIARSYGALLSPEKVLAGLNDAVRKPLHLCRVYGANGRQCFLESVGVGVMAQSIELPKVPTREQKRDQGRQALAHGLTDIAPVACEIALDGEPFEERALMLEVMNIAIIGPNLRLLSPWDPEAKELTVTWLPTESRQDMIAWLAEPDGRPPPMRRRQARRVDFKLDGEHIHVADDVLPELRGSVTVERDGGTLQILVPRAAP